MKSIRFLPPAETELREAVEYLEQRRLGMGRRLLLEVETIAGKIAEFPSLGHVGVEGYRGLLLPGFPFTVVYQERAEECLVVALAHTSRRPGYWRVRRN
jgi:plasmid stabilization system protein ParE